MPIYRTFPLREIFLSLKELPDNVCLVYAKFPCGIFQNFWTPPENFCIFQKPYFEALRKCHLITFVLWKIIKPQPKVFKLFKKFMKMLGMDLWFFTLSRWIENVWRDFSMKRLFEVVRSLKELPENVCLVCAILAISKVAFFETFELLHEIYKSGVPMKCLIDFALCRWMENA